jgi:hypothetical protein
MMMHGLANVKRDFTFVTSITNQVPILRHCLEQDSTKQKLMSQGKMFRAGLGQQRTQ